MRRVLCAALCALVLVSCNRQTTKVDVSVGSPLAPTSPTNPPAATQVSVNTVSEAIGDCSKTIVFVSDQNVNWSATGPSISFTGSNSNTTTATVVIKGNGNYTVTATPLSSAFTARSVTITVTELKDCAPAPSPAPTPTPTPTPPPPQSRSDKGGIQSIIQPSPALHVAPPHPCCFR